MVGRQLHLAPNLHGRALAPLEIILIRPAVVEKVELDELDAQVFEIEQRAFDAAPVGIQMADAPKSLRPAAADAGRGPVVLPVHPGKAAVSDRLLAAAATRSRFLNLPLKPCRRFVRERAKPLRRKVEAGYHVACPCVTSSEAEHRSG